VADATSDRASGGRGEETLVRTFLLADVRGYTRYTAEHGDDAASALARRLAGLVGATVPEFGGELLEVRGDETLCVFSSARQALRAAVDVQRRLRAPEESEPFPLGVGMGLDAGEATPTDGGYRGAALNMAGRLVSAAGPGEVLATERLVRLSGPVGGLHWSRPRSMRLKGLADPELVVRVESDEPLPQPPAPPSERGSRTRRRTVLAAAAVVVAVAGTGAWWSTTGSSRVSVTLRADSVAILDPATGRIEGDVRLRGVPAAIVAGPQDVWAAEPNLQEIAKIDPATLKPHEHGVSVAPSSLAADGKQLVVYDGETSHGVTIDSATFAQSPFQVPAGHCGGYATFDCYQGGLVVGGGYVWVGVSQTQSTWRLAPDTLEVDGKPVRHVYPDQLAYGLNRVWALGYAGNWLAEIDPRTATRLNLFSPPGRGHTGAQTPPLATGDNLVWLLEGSGNLVTVDPTGTSGPTVALGEGLTALTIANGNIWVTSSTGLLYRVSLYTRKLTDIIHLHHPAEGVAVGYNRVWVTLGH
jgi:class 3 adenylate cyclase